MAIGDNIRRTERTTIGSAAVFFFDTTLNRDVNVGWTDNASFTWEWEESRIEATSPGAPRRLIKRGIAVERVRATAQILEISTDNLTRILPLYRQSTGHTIPIYDELVTLTGTTASQLKRTNLLTGSTEFRLKLATESATVLVEDTGTFASPNGDGHYITNRTTGQVKRVDPTTVGGGHPIAGAIPNGEYVAEYTFTDSTAKVMTGGGLVCAPPQNRKVTFYHVRDNGNGTCNPMLFVLERAIAVSPVSLPFNPAERTVMELTLEGVANPNLPSGAQVWKFIEAAAA